MPVSKNIVFFMGGTLFRTPIPLLESVVALALLLSISNNTITLYRRELRIRRKAVIGTKLSKLYIKPEYNIL